MSTRGVCILRKGKEEKGLYIPYDAYPDGAGMEVVDLIRSADLSALFENMTDYDNWDEEGHPDDPDFFVSESLKMAAAGIRRLWVESAMKDFILDSLSCEYGYVIDLDQDRLEFYVGYQKEPQNGNPYGTKPLDKYDKPYYPCRLAAVFTLEHIRYTDSAQIIEEMNHSKKTDEAVFYDKPSNPSPIQQRSVKAMSEKMLVTQALDERDLLVKKITDKIRRAKLVDTKKRNEDRTVDERVTAEEFGKAAQSAWQQIMDLIDRYQRIDAAIVASNAATWIETSYGRYTVAAAISLRSRLRTKVSLHASDADFEGMLQNALEMQYNAGVNLASDRNKALEKQAEAMRLSILGKDTKVRDDKPLEVVEAYVKENTTELVDPLGAEKRIAEMKERKEKLLSELETQIKVSNATTFIEF